jgi:glycosyltransferase involved in cell wall biosynthesis
VNQPNVEASGAISAAKLRDLFSSSHIFVMPSLVEGFGLVYLEALSAGCYVIATPNTGVPDLCLPESTFSQVEVGNLSQLTNTLRVAANLHMTNGIDHAGIADVATRLSWRKFREGLISSLRQFCELPNA